MQGVIYPGMHRPLRPIILAVWIISQVMQYFLQINLIYVRLKKIGKIS